MGSDMAAKLLDANGKLKPFRQWLDDVSSISTHHCGAWLRTEYDTAVIRAHNAADWQSFLRNKDVMPNLRWMPTTSPNPESSHRKFWEKKLTLPVDDPFWTKHHPGDRWNCKCSLEQTDDPVNRSDDIDSVDPPQRGLENNPGKDGHTFSDNHPYFPSGCSSCPFNKGFKNRIKTVFSNANNKKHCFNCSKIDNALSDAQKKLKGMDDVTPPHVEEYTVSGLNKDVFISPWHGENEVEENEKLAKFLAKKLGKKIYLLPRLEQNNKKQAALRKTLLPPGVKEGKNPDYLIGGILFDGKSMMNIEPITGVKAQKKNELYRRKIQTRIANAFEQADGAIIEVPKFVSRRNIARAVKGKLKLVSENKYIIIKHGNSCYVYNKPYLKQKKQG